jgi:hypothetical protein
MIDPVYIINVVAGRPMFSGICPRKVAEFWLAEYGDTQIKIAEIDPRLKTEYADFLVKSR